MLESPLFKSENLEGKACLYLFIHSSTHSEIFAELYHDTLAYLCLSSVEHSTRHSKCSGMDGEYHEIIGNNYIVLFWHCPLVQSCWLSCILTVWFFHVVSPHEKAVVCPFSTLPQNHILAANFTLYPELPYIVRRIT